jgi:hypothetical protein
MFSKTQTLTYYYELQYCSNITAPVPRPFRYYIIHVAVSLNYCLSLKSVIGFGLVILTATSLIVPPAYSSLIESYNDTSTTRTLSLYR